MVTGEAGSGEEMTNAKAEDFYTRPDEAESFCKATGVYVLVFIVFAASNIKQRARFRPTHKTLRKLSNFSAFAYHYLLRNSIK